MVPNGTMVLVLARTSTRVRTMVHVPIVRTYVHVYVRLYTLTLRTCVCTRVRTYVRTYDGMLSRALGVGDYREPLRFPTCGFLPYRWHPHPSENTHAHTNPNLNMDVMFPPQAAEATLTTQSWSRMHRSSVRTLPGELRPAPSAKSSSRGRRSSVERRRLVSGAA
jgi:hypothetical protein